MLFWLQFDTWLLIIIAVLLWAVLSKLVAILQALLRVGDKLGDLDISGKVTDGIQEADRQREMDQSADLGIDDV